MKKRIIKNFKHLFKNENRKLKDVKDCPKSKQGKLETIDKNICINSECIFNLKIDYGSYEIHECYLVK